MANKYVVLKTIPPEASLYHYTKCGGAQGILSERNIWATRSDFLNDINEIQYIISVAGEVLKELEKPEWRRLLENHLARTASEMKKNDYYILSFSAEGDSITLWSEFGEKTGYNLQFQSGELLRQIEHFRKVAYHGYVIYSGREQRKIIRDLIWKSIPEAQGCSFEDIMEEGVKNKESAVFRKFCRSFQKALAIYALFFKQEEFAAEGEYRMAFKKKEEERVMFEAKSGFLRPYIPVRLADGKMRIPIQSITVAPKNHVDLAKKGMAEYMKYMGYDVEIRLSRIKLRY